MKKLLAVTAAALVALAGAFADDDSGTVVHSFGTAFVGQTQTLDNVDDDTASLNSGAFNLYYNKLLVKESRFSTFRNMELGIINYSFSDYDFATRDEDFEDDGYDNYISGTAFNPDSISGVNTSFLWGFGAAPLNTERVILAIHGTFGFDIGFASQSYTTTLTATSRRSSTSYDFDCDFTAFNFVAQIGANVQAAFRLGEHIGLSAGLTLSTNLTGMTFTYASAQSEDMDVNFHHFDGFITNFGNINADLRLGVALIY